MVHTPTKKTRVKKFVEKMKNIAEHPSKKKTQLHKEEYSNYVKVVSQGKGDYRLRFWMRFKRNSYEESSLET